MHVGVFGFPNKQKVSVSDGTADNADVVYVNM